MEIKKTVSQKPLENGFFFPRVTYVKNKKLKFGSWNKDPLMRFARKKFSTWSESSNHPILMVSGEISTLQSPIHQNLSPKPTQFPSSPFMYRNIPKDPPK